MARRVYSSDFAYQLTRSRILSYDYVRAQEDTAKRDTMYYDDIIPAIVVSPIFWWGGKG